MSEVLYDIAKTKPVARFFYRGHHSHPVRRTVLIISTDRQYITGYELREGEEVRNLEDAPVKTFRKDRIPTYDDYWRLRRYNRPEGESTLKRYSLANLKRRGA